MEVYDQTESKPSFPYVSQAGSDFHLQFLKLDRDGLWTSKDLIDSQVLHILVALDSHSREEKQKIFNEGLKFLCQGGADFTLMLATQIEEADLELKDFEVSIFPAGKYLLVVKDTNSLTLAEATRQKIVSYQREATNLKAISRKRSSICCRLPHYLKNFLYSIYSRL